ncbi:actin like protein ALP2a [Besnoitia besnoiti]|uniref:Actin like protein ALP2a n=1 Tax=Besnoitia besnoiti TaxID=94643 RepID=A0A2A9M3Z2_BESBE|nr:actin like protein ALP2a [Besnoitia besnoiti]PFH33208.1 actin like protein ALP2a [Besnoitia besnoiti]
MEVPIPAFVVDVGSLATRVGYAGDDCPWQFHPSFVGISASSKELRFPLSFSEKRRHLAVEPCLYPTFPSASSLSPSPSSSPASLLPSYSLHEDAFECILRSSISCCLSPSPAACAPAGDFCAPDDFGAAGESLRDFPVLLSEPNLHCRALREKMVELAFEKLDVPALYLAPRAMLACFAVGRSGGLVVDVGASSLSIAPVVEGFCLHREAGEWPVAGDFLDRVFSCALTRHNLPLLPLFATHKKYGAGAGGGGGGASASAPLLGSTRPHAASSAAVGADAGAKARAQARRRELLDWEGVEESFLYQSQAAALRHMRETFCSLFLGEAPTAAEPKPAAATGGPGLAPEKAPQKCPLRPLALPAPAREKAFAPSRWLAMLPAPGGNVRSLHGASVALLGSQNALELPDGTRLQGDELSNTIPEVLFHPQAILQPLAEEEAWVCEPAVEAFRGITEEIHAVASRVEAEARKDVFNGIVLAGGCSGIPGLYERLSRELTRDASITMGLKWRLLALPSLFERRISSWIGGSILASMSAFQSLWCSREEYDEHGASIVERKCY